MQQILDVEKFEELQEGLVRELIEQIRFKLAKGGITGDQLHDLTLEIAFSVTSTIDDQANIQHDDVEVHPLLSFVGNEGEIIHCGENSFGHELVSELVKQVFSN